jgi:membrane protease YdiL (CAAX protease family)
MTTVVNGLFLGMVVACVTLWSRFLRGHLPLLSVVRQCEPQPIARWSLFDLIAVLVCVFFPQVLVQAVVQAWTFRPLPAAAARLEAPPKPTNDPPPAAKPDQAANSPPAAKPERTDSPDLELVRRDPGQFVLLMWLRAAALVIGTTLGLAWVYVRHRDRLVLGGDWGRWRTDIALGVVGFLMLAPPVLLMQLALTQLFPSQHPLIELVLAKPEARFLWAAGVTAVLVAPLVEEFQFRVLIQGWLQTAARPGIPSESWLVGAPSPEWEAAPSEPPRHWPAIAASAVFALAHASHGPDPIPLFFFAWGIGLLYRGTGRVLPGIVVHLLLNLWTLLLLLVRIYGSSLT